MESYISEANMSLGIYGCLRTPNFCLIMTSPLSTPLAKAEGILSGCLQTGAASKACKRRCTEAFASESLRDDGALAPYLSR
ncbi:MAG: hypothetical protein AAFQ14_15840 [Cyanobacteria bacterium J06621_12]